MSNFLKFLSGKASPTGAGASSPAGGNIHEEGADEPTLEELLQHGAPIGRDRSQFLPPQGHFQQGQDVRFVIDDEDGGAGLLHGINPF